MRRTAHRVASRVADILCRVRHGVGGAGGGVTEALTDVLGGLANSVLSELDRLLIWAVAFGKI